MNDAILDDHIAVTEIGPVLLLMRASSSRRMRRSVFAGTSPLLNFEASA